MTTADSPFPKADTSSDDLALHPYGARERRLSVQSMGSSRSVSPSLNHRLGIVHEHSSGQMPVGYRQPSGADRRYAAQEEKDVPESMEENDTYSALYPPASSGSQHDHLRTTGNDTARQQRPKPVPYKQIFPLCLSRASEGMIFAVILPYINEMIRGLGVEEQMVGVWSGMAESSLMIAEAITAPLFAPLADRYGRRPIFLICVFAWGVGAVSFGLVNSVMLAVVCRGFLGLLAGAGVLSRTMVGELCDKSNRIRAFAVFSPSLTVGVTLGPVIGGFLSNPVPKLLPSSFTLFTTFPYLLPSLVAGTSGFLAWGTSCIYLPETLPPSLRRAERETNKLPKPSALQLMRYKPFQHVLILYGMTNAVQFSFEAIYPLFAFTRKDLGGLELPTDTIGVVLGLSAALSIFMTIFLFPILHRTIREDTYLVICLICYTLSILFFPFLWAMHYTAPPQAGLEWGTIGVMCVQMILRRIGDFSGTMLDTIIFDTIPSPNFLVTANSLTFSIGAIGRAIGPFVVSYLFSMSTHYDSSSPARQIVWVGFVLISLPGVSLGWQMRKRGGGHGNGGGKAESGGVDEEERVELIRRDVEPGSVH